MAATCTMADEWTLIYYGGMVGRAEFLRLIFEEAGVPYKEIGDIDVIKHDFLEGKGDLYPHFAPPVIKKGEPHFLHFKFELFFKAKN